jgi:hypothetical protein
MFAVLRPGETDHQVLCRRLRFPPWCRHLHHSHTPPTENQFRLPRNPPDIHHLHFIRDDADIFRLEGVLFSSMES